MPESPDRPPTERESRELAALADGSLPERRRAVVEARVASSPRLQALLEAQRSALEAIRAREHAAPPSLRKAVATQRDRRVQRGGRRHIRVAAGLVASAAALIVALAVVLHGPGPGTPTMAQAAGLAMRVPEHPAPGSYPKHQALLDLEVDEVVYPNWDAGLGWRAVGSRADRIEGRGAQTLFYERGGRRLAYTIVSGASLPSPAGARRWVRDGTELRSFRLSGRIVVTWKRRQHTCVLSGSGVSREVLLRLGAWKHGGAIPY